MLALERLRSFQRASNCPISSIPKPRSRAPDEAERMDVTLVIERCAPTGARHRVCRESAPLPRPE